MMKNFPVLKQIPNLITSVRLFAAIAIFVLAIFAPDHGARHFVWLFCSAGVSDMLDGFIARRFNLCTEFGAKLDSISDLSLYVSAITYLFYTAPQALQQVSPVIWLGAFTQVFHLAYSYWRFRTFPSYHSDFTRFAAYLIFFLLLLFLKTTAAFLLGTISVIWFLCSLEGIAISVILRESASDLKGINEALAIRAKSENPKVLA